MEKYTRYLTSQHLGRVTTTVSFDALYGGVVQLTAELGSVSAINLSIPVDVLKMLDNSPDDWRELVIRLAVSQAHKCIAKGACATSLVALDFEATLWRGDVLSIPYGGATLGMECRARGRSYHGHSWRQT